MTVMRLLMEGKILQYNRLSTVNCQLSIKWIKHMAMSEVYFRSVIRLKMNLNEFFWIETHYTYGKLRKTGLQFITYFSAIGGYVRGRGKGREGIGHFYSDDFSRFRTRLRREKMVNWICQKAIRIDTFTCSASFSNEQLSSIMPLVDCILHFERRVRIERLFGAILLWLWWEWTFQKECPAIKR
ncbi:MAG: hypothetical protein EXX96DRAFT_540787 [Benjaminiella poitrasii]|nr:MAG: hypothetical protein EXX96DRAFT_540787 [Benjaminiella poitrasii]